VYFTAAQMAHIEQLVQKSIKKPETVAKRRFLLFVFWSKKVCFSGKIDQKAPFFAHF